MGEGKDVASDNTEDEKPLKTKALWKGKQDEFSRKRFAFWSERFKAMTLTEI
jgi:hypothetical protein